MIVNGQLYKIINIKNGKGYVGLTGQTLGKTYIDRFEEHIAAAERGEKGLLYDAIRKYGKENFRIELLEEGITNRTELGEGEKHYIKIYNTYAFSKDGFGYNMTIGGEGTSGYVYTEEQRKERSEQSKNLWLDPEYRRKSSEASKNLWLDLEYRKKISKPVVIFKNGEYLNEFDSMTEAAQALLQETGGKVKSLRNGLGSMINRKRKHESGPLKDYCVMHLSYYEKLKEDPSKLNEYLKEYYYNPKDVVILKNGEEIGVFRSILEAVRALEQAIGGNLWNGIWKLLNDDWEPKWGQLKGYEAMYLSEYEKRQEDLLQKIS